jgi:DNA-binding GntR family transcriptional regulator
MTLQRQTVSVQVTDQLREEIQNGVLAPGVRLRQADIAARFGVSITPVREAFNKLAGEGLVVIDQHRGAVVFWPTLSDFRECFEIREVLEALAISKAVPKLTDDDFVELDLLIEKMRHATEISEWVELNDRFHLRTYQPAGEPRLLRLIAGLRDASVAYLNMFAATRVRDREHLELEHRAILEACRARDVDAAVAAIKEHLRRPVLKALAEGAAADGASTSQFKV